MTGDTVEEFLNNEKSEKIEDNIDTMLLSNLTENYIEPVEDIPCPEFQFSTHACYICNGYYGPSFDEPVCATCHAFLFPDDIGIRALPIFSEKTDDEDSGNDEPTDPYYNWGEGRINQTPKVRPLVESSSSGQHDSPIHHQQVLINENLQSQPEHHKKPHEWIKKINNNQSGPSLPHNSHSSPVDNPNDGILNRDNEAPHWNCRDFCNLGEPSKPKNLAERVEILTNHKHIEHEPINEPGLVDRLPPEVLLAVFSHLDDVSLWSAANVCRRWYGLLLTHIPPQQWQQQAKLRWPLYKAIGHVDNWYKVYDRLASSAPCRTCLAQMCLRSKPANMEENSWRKNRLNIELKALRIDPPEGIEASPLDAMSCHWQATITGPIGSPYEGGLFYLYLQVPYSYPMCPPVVRFLTKILHPNVSRHGDVGIDSIHHNWSLALTISKVLISVQSLLTDPFCQVCMEPEIGEMYTYNREKFEEVARAWTWKYAMHDVVTP